MTLDTFLTGLVYLTSALVLLVFGKLTFDRLRPRFVLKKELFENDNPALATAVAGYYLGLVLAVGGLLSGPSTGLVDDLLDIGIYGFAAVVLLNLSAWINDRVILRKFDNQKEILDDRNVGTGAIEAGSFIATGLMVGGAASGQGGDLLTMLAFWGLGQGVLVLGGLAYDLTSPFDLHDEVERDNVAVGLAFGGLLVALGNLARLGSLGDFESWSVNLGSFGAYVAVGLLLLPVVRVAVDRLLVPGARLADELTQKGGPNAGAGLLEGTAYVAASLLIGWAV
ncbi:MAG: DUF350 domain-containing protein [Acidobacteriota bacterium]